ncbi:MAG TPA: ATP-binding cassette domain-containing protein, partial [Caulobacteraceae bacterium]|nr:ATP-binding cassette domain-containing protein [Caulobacteraceae bacterium]
MTSAGEGQVVAVASGLGKRLGPKAHPIQVLEDVTLSAGAGLVTALVGSDGAGKTTLMRLMAGLLPPDAGVVTVLGLDVAKDPQSIQSRIGYMPQRFGLYDDLRVRENLDLYADLHGVSAAGRRERYPALMEMTALAPFMDRLAGQLSGGMKQKLGLACTLIATPELLLLDEPTAGVDPLSRRELWQIIHGLVRDQRLPVIVSTSYLDEADACDHVIVLNRGRVLAQGAPASVSRAADGRVFLLAPRGTEKARDLQARLLAMPQVVDAVPEAGRVRVVLNSDEPPASIADLGAMQPTQAHFEDGFMTLLRATATDQAFAAPTPAPAVDPPPPQTASPEVAVKGLVRRFGAFTAVDNISFDVGRGEIFGLLGPNGAGKTTTFRMLCGLLPVTGGELRIGGADMRRARA